MAGDDDGLYAALVRRGMTRRSFLRFSAAMAAVLALPTAYAPRIAAAVTAAPRLPVIWLRGQSCDGNTQAFLQATKPSVPDLILDLLSVDYHELLMAVPGSGADLSRTATMEEHPDGYIAVIEGSIPTAEGGAFCTVAGRPFGDIAREVCDGALAVIAVGSCAFDGGLAAAAGGRTGAAGAGGFASGATLINLPGCPLNVENLTATIVHFLTFGEWPVTDSRRRPLFAYGGLIHNQCERRAHYEFGEFVLAWGDEGAQKGWCLYKMGCKGPEAFANCATTRYASEVSWPIKAGHGCVGCTMPGFWDAMSPFYRRLGGPIPFAPEVTADQAGVALVGGIAALAGVHGAASYARARLAGSARRRAAAAAALGDATAGIDEPVGGPPGADALEPVAAGGADAAARWGIPEADGPDVPDDVTPADRGPEAD